MLWSDVRANQIRVGDYIREIDEDGAADLAHVISVAGPDDDGMVTIEIDTPFNSTTWSRHIWELHAYAMLQRLPIMEIEKIGSLEWLTRDDIQAQYIYELRAMGAI